MTEQTRQNRWHRAYENGTGVVVQFGATSHIGSFTPCEPPTGNSATSERPHLADAQAAMEKFAGKPSDDWVADKLNT